MTKSVPREGYWYVSKNDQVCEARRLLVQIFFDKKRGLWPCATASQHPIVTPQLLANHCQWFHSGGIALGIRLKKFNLKTTKSVAREGYWSRRRARRLLVQKFSTKKGDLPREALTLTLQRAEREGSQMTNLRNRGLISEDRSSKATLLFTIPRSCLSRLHRIYLRRF